MSSMHKKALAFGLLAVSAATIAAVNPVVPQEAPRPATPGAGGQVAPSILPRAVHPSPYSAQSHVASALARWTSLRQTDGLPFSSYSSFLSRYRGWPGENAMRRTAEKAIEPGVTPASDVIAFFRIHPPLTPGGHAHHAAALLSMGRVEEARNAARAAWHGGALGQETEQRVLAQFGAALTPADHDRRMDALLDAKSLDSARRTLAYASGLRRPLYAARIALQGRAPDASVLVAGLGSAADGDAGLLLDRANWLRTTGQSSASRELLARPRRLVTRPDNAEKFMEGVLAIARGAAADSQWTLAYQIASQLDDIFPQGTDVSTRSVGERDEYTSLAWLAGSAAYHRIGRPADAIGMFERYGRAARSFQTRSKGFYWAAQAAQRAGQPERANVALEQAALYPDLFYGQLALERLGRPIPAPAQLAMVPPADPVALAFEQRDLVQALKLLGQQGRWEDQSLFVRTLSEQVATDQERILAGQLALRIGRPDLGVWVGRSSRNAGSAFYTSASFPQIRVPPERSQLWALANAITRQESSFDRAAVSHADARGMMQLMPGTAAETAGKLGLPYSRARLTSDPQYNVMLGSRYFAGLMERYGNYAPLAVAAYNAGPGNVNRWVRENGDPRMPGVDVLKWIEEIPFMETRNYVQRVLENAVVYDLVDPNSRNAVRRNRLSAYLGRSNLAG